MGITIKDIARRAKVSVSTVSVVLRGAKNPLISATTSDRVRAVARQLGYRPNLAARNLRTRHSNTVGMVTHATRGFAVRAIAAIELLLRGHDYDLLLGFSDNTPEREWRYIDKLYGVQVDGLLVAPSRYKEEESLRYYREIPVPIVLLDGADDSDFCCCKKDRATGVAMLVHHLHRVGRRRIALSQVHTMDYANRERLEGYRRALGELGLPFDESLLLYTQPEPIVNGADLVPLVTRQLAAVDAVVCGDDYIAASLITGLRAAGVDVPREVGVVGFYDSPGFSENFDPPITTLEHDFVAMGQKACELLLERMKAPDDQPPPPPVVWSPEPQLIVRQSCGAVDSS